MPVSPGFDKEPRTAETSVEPSSTEEHFPPPQACEDFTEDVQVGAVAVGGAGGGGEAGAEAGDEIIMDIEDELKNKKNRHRQRKRKIYAELCKQVEFYFSDANISKNRNMAELVTQSDYVDLHHLLGFNKIQKILPELDLSYLQKALALSQLLELSPEKEGVKRRIPYDPAKVKSPEEVEKCTIYVENVPTHVDHEWLEKIFQEFGPIAYVSMPKFKHNGLPKGFAFVEFKDEEGAERCLNAYGDKGACLANNINPGSLLSVRTFENADNSMSPVTSSEGELAAASNVSSSNQGSRKRPRQDSESSKEDVPAKREKTEGGTSRTNDDGNEIQSDQVDSSGVQSNSGGENGTQSEKKKRKKNYKTKKLDNIEKRESESIQLKILPKAIWRQLRNRYLNLQRENLGKLKRQLRHQPSPTQREFPARSQARRPSQQTEEKRPESGSQKPRSVIIKLDFKDPFESEDTFKSFVSTNVTPKDCPTLVQFFDYSPPDSHAYVRLSGNPDYISSVSELLRNATAHFKSASVLTEKEQQEYWAVVRQKIKGEAAKKKIRGRDRLLQQAMKTATHIRFTDDDSVNDSVQKDENGARDAVHDTNDSKDKETSEPLVATT